MDFLYFAFGSLAALGLAAILASKKLIKLPDQHDRVGHIDGMRGYLALAVMCHHFFITMDVYNGGVWALPKNNFVANLGQVGVSIFFMVTGTLFYSKMTESPLKTDWIKLYISRIFRIIPLMAFVAVVISLIAALKSGNLDKLFDPGELASIAKWVLFLGEPKLFGFDNAGLIMASATWSLRYEWQFYFSLPICAVIIYNASKVLDRKYLLIGFLLFSYVLLCFDPDLAKKAATFAPLFLTGMLAAELRKGNVFGENLKGARAAVIGFAALLVEMFFFHGALGFPQFVLLALFFIPVVCGNSYFSVFSKKTSRYLGEISYSIYLVHGIILYLIFKVSQAPNLVANSHLDLESLFPLAAVLAVVIPTMTHKYIEVPGIGFGRFCNELRSGLVTQWSLRRNKFDVDLIAARNEEPPPSL